MAVPKRKTSKANTRMRRAHDALPKPNPSTCPNCSAPKLPHRVCLECGWYGPADGGRVVLVSREDELEEE